MEIVVFYIFAAIVVAAALGVILLRNPVHSALALALVFVCLAAMYVLLNAPFIAAAQVMIYAGAILILFLFVIMLLAPEPESGAGALRFQRAFAALFGGALILELVLVVASAAIPAPAKFGFLPAAPAGDVYAIGKLLFTDFLLPFEITSLLLLVAMVGVIVLAKKKA
ncbi:MAG: NADH-quinone oxidoreductase subunit J [Chloroflexi bacterium]|nr:NADH-quinone oxidoreductase subunit J [Chloroflexota bacterium]